MQGVADQQAVEKHRFSAARMWHMDAPHFHWLQAIENKGSGGNRVFRFRG